MDWKGLDWDWPNEVKIGNRICFTKHVSPCILGSIPRAVDAFDGFSIPISQFALSKLALRERDACLQRYSGHRNAAQRSLPHFRTMKPALFDRSKLRQEH